MCGNLVCFLVLLVLAGSTKSGKSKNKSGKSNRLSPVGHQWVENTRYSEYQGVTVPDIGRMGDEVGDVTLALKQCNAADMCQGVTETDKDKWRMVKRLALTSAGDNMRIYHKSGSRRTTQTTETKSITVSRWTDFAELGRWGEIKGYKFKQLYGSTGKLKDVMRVCAGEKDCNGVSMVGDDEWRAGKGRELEQGTLTWAKGSNMGASHDVQTGGGSVVKDGWHRGHFNVKYG